MQKIRLSAVSYLNTKPFIYGIFRSKLSEKIDLSLDIPSVCAQKLLCSEADLVLTPVAVIPELPEAHLVSDYCIGSTGPVKTVCIFSEKPLSEIKRLYLDFHSRTSVALSRLLCQEFWKIEPEFVPAEEGYEQKIGGDTAGLIIGDRAIGLEKNYPYVYDLGQAWMDFTGLPFVFAAWVSTRPLDPAFIAEFNEALLAGIESIPQLIYLIPPPHPDFDLKTYFTRHISYPLDAAKRKGLDLFLSYLAPGLAPLGQGALAAKG